MRLEVLSDKAKAIFLKLKNFSDFYLAGGTALALQIGRRISVDFDLFSDKEIPENFLDKVKKYFIENSLSVSVNNHDELTVFIDEIKITFLKYPFPVLFELVDYKEVKLLDIREIAATKAYTIGRRGSYKDYVDLYFVVSEKYISLEEIIDICEKKYGNDFNSRLFLEQLIYLEDIEDTEIIFLQDVELDKKTIQTFFEKEIKKIKL